MNTSRVHASSRNEPKEPRLDGSAYDVLDVAHDVDERAIKLAYHKVARVWHPDVCTQANAKEVFAHVARAHEILRNPQQRRIYDLVLANRILPLVSTERFQSFYAQNARPVDFAARHRAAVGWALAGVAGALAIGVRTLWWRRQHDGHGATAEASDALPPKAPAAAVGGILGATAVGGSAAASSGRGWRTAVAASLAGAIGGQVTLPFVERSVRGLRSLRSHAANRLVHYGQPLCEVLGAGAALVLYRRAHGVATPLRELPPLRALRAGVVGAAFGHALGWIATFGTRRTHTGTHSERSETERVGGG